VVQKSGHVVALGKKPLVLRNFQKFDSIIIGGGGLTEFGG
jgi:precorrin-6B methylase 2